MRRWKRSRPATVAVAAAIVIACGMVGFSHVPLTTVSGRVVQPSLLDDLYRSLQLFALGGGNAATPDVFLEIARFLGPTVVGYAAVGAVLGMYREQLNRFWASRMRYHVVVAGLGDTGLRLAHSFADEGWPVVVVEADPSHPGLASCRERGIRALVGDATDRCVLRRAAAQRASLLLAMCGDDRVNMDIGAAARSVSAERRRQVLTALVQFDNFDLWYVMKAQALMDREQSAFRLELVNLWALAADVLLDEHPPFAPGERAPHVAVVGDKGHADNIVVGVVRRWLAASGPDSGVLRLSLVGPEGAFDDLFGRYPGLDRLPEVDIRSVVTKGTGAGCFDQAAADAEVTYVAMDDEATALSVAIVLREQPGRPADARIVVSVEDDEAGVAQAVGHGGPVLEGVSAFGWSSRALRPGALLDRTATEVIARLGHRHHCEHQWGLGKSAGDDPSLVPWEQLPQGLKESNRLWADGMAAKLASLNCAICPAPFTRPGDDAFRFEPDEVEALAPLEHERFSADMKRMGLRQGPRDAGHHPFIDVPFEQLPEENREKDREHVRAIPVVLAQAGFAVRRLPAPAAPSTAPSVLQPAPAG